jgi:hypothetical protein
MRTLLAVCLVSLAALHACSMGGGGDRVTYTPFGVAQRTFPRDFPTVVQAVQKALGTLEMPVREVRSVEENGQRVRAEMTAAAAERRVTVTVERVTATSTRVEVNVQKLLVKDRATAAAILAETSRNLE